jgi:hypothetical protein
MAGSLKTMGAWGIYFDPAGAAPASGWAHPGAVELAREGQDEKDDSNRGVGMYNRRRPGGEIGNPGQDVTCSGIGTD